MSKECLVCGKSNPEEAKYCKKCGTYLSSTILEKPKAKSESREAKHISQMNVAITDVNIPFSSMVVLIVKWTMASIPALFILFIFGAIIIGMLGGLSAIM